MALPAPLDELMKSVVEIRGCLVAESRSGAPAPTLLTNAPPDYLGNRACRIPQLTSVRNTPQSALRLRTSASSNSYVGHKPLSLRMQLIIRGSPPRVVAALCKFVSDMVCGIQTNQFHQTTYPPPKGQRSKRSSISPFIKSVTPPATVYSKPNTGVKSSSISLLRRER